VAGKRVTNVGFWLEAGLPYVIDMAIIGQGKVTFHPLPFLLEIPIRRIRVKNA